MEINENLEKIVNVVKKIIPLREAYLFGSFAYGTPNQNSDFDLYFVVDKIEGSKHDNIVAIHKAIDSIRIKPVDVLLNTKEYFDYRKGNRSTLEHVVAEEGDKLYG